jgi:hypothetical protein
MPLFNRFTGNASMIGETCLRIVMADLSFASF